jgi:hypothetical protein
MPLTPGVILNQRYRIEQLLGQGGFGAVYRAWDLNLELPCAVKENLNISQSSQSQFRREFPAGDAASPQPAASDRPLFIPEQGQYLVMTSWRAKTCSLCFVSAPLLPRPVLPGSSRCATP